MNKKVLEELKQFRHDNRNSFFDMGVVETKMYINSNNYVSFEIKTFRTPHKINPDYRERFDEAVDNFKKLYNYNDSVYFNEDRDDYNVKEYRYQGLTKTI